MKQDQNNKQQRQARFFLVLPLIAVPFITLLFWALGGGKPATAQAANVHAGINTQLPKAHLQDNPQADKLSFYEQAQKDSVKEKEEQKDDPYYKGQGLGNATEQPGGTNGLYTTGLNYSGSADVPAHNLADNERAVQQRLDALQQRISQPPARTPEATPPEDATQQQLAALQAKLSQGDADDPEMKQINGTLDKLLSLEHPELLKQQLHEQSEKSRGIVFPVSGHALQVDHTFFGAADTGRSRIANVPNGFYGLDSTGHAANENAILAIVHGTQTLENGATIKLRLLQSVFINGILVPKDNFVYGTCALEADRLNIEIKNMRLGGSVYPVSLKAFDLDGLPGIHVPDAISRDAAKDGADQAIQSLDFYSLSPSVGAQAASAGVQAVKGLFSRKVRLIKVTVKSGYTVLLANANQFNQ